MKVRLNNYQIQSEKIKNDINLMVVSDIHSNIEIFKTIKKLLNDINYLIIVGDTLDSANDELREDVLKEIKDLSDYIDIIISLGNHDITIYINKINQPNTPDLDFFSELEKVKNIYILSHIHDYVSLNDDISVGAINMPLSFYLNKEKEGFDEVYKKWSSSVNDNKFNILLSHTPNPFINDNKLNTDLSANTDLILAGHNHGGLTPQFIQNRSKSHRGLVGPYGNLFPSNAYGYWNNDISSLLLTNGITKISKSSELFFIYKLLNKIYIPDIEIVNITSGSKKLALTKRQVTKI